MNNEIKYIDIKQQVLQQNDNDAGQVRARLRENGVMLLNLMSSPGSGKTSVIVGSLRSLKGHLKAGVIEGDMESIVDSEKIAAEGAPAVQLRTGDMCHLEASMVNAALDSMDLQGLDLIFVENVGNLVCPADFDVGAHRSAMILSVPEGDDKILKYPLMFSVVDALIINKTDFLPYSDFDMEALRERMAALNPNAAIFEVSCKTGEGLGAWSAWLMNQVEA